MGVDSFDLPIKEKTFNFNDACKKVSMVKPLQSPGPEAAKTSENVYISQLDWSRIFSFLTTIIRPSELKLFMVHLVDGKDTSVDTIVDRVQYETSSSAEQIYKCLYHWKQLVGNEADPQHIIKAMEERGLNEDAYKFKEFMRNPPTVKSKINSVEPYKSVCAPERTNSIVYMITGASNFGSCWNESACTRNTTTPIIEEIVTPAPYYAHSKEPVNRQRKLPIHQLFRHGKKKRKTLNKSTYEQNQHFKTLRRRKSRKYLRDKIQLQKQCIINLMKDPTSLQEVAYDTLMYYAIDCLIKYTNAPEDEIFSLKYTDYEKIQKTSHSENDELYLLNCETVGKFRVVGKEEYETLKLYVENARNRRVKELKDLGGKGFVEPEELFMNYKGEPTSTENVRTKRHYFATTLSSTSDENSESNTSLSSLPYVEAENHYEGAISDESFDKSADSEVLPTGKVLISMNTEAQQTTTSVGQNITTLQDTTSNNDITTLNICIVGSKQQIKSTTQWEVFMK